MQHNSDDTMAASKKISKKVIDSHLQLLHKLGTDGLYKRAIGVAMMSVAKINNPDIGLLDLSDSFLSLYRRTGELEYLTISRVLRRSAHVVYRQLMKQNNNKKPNMKRFLTVVS